LGFSLDPFFLFLLLFFAFSGSSFPWYYMYIGYHPF